LIDLVTTMAFLSAPIAGYLNFRLITSAATPTDMQPGGAMRALSWIGLVILTALGGVFVWLKLQ
jgi:hypothetical protein